MNKIILIGNLTRDPELKSTPTGKTVCSFDIAVNSRGRQQMVQYFHVDAWGPLGENCQRYLAKGRKVYVSGPADDVEFLSPRDESTGYVQQPSFHAPQMQQRPVDMTPVETDELPF